MGCSPWGCKESDTTERLHLHWFLVSVEDICICVGVGAKYNRVNCEQQMRKDQDGFSENVMFAVGWGIVISQSSQTPFRNPRKK